MRMIGAGFRPRSSRCDNRDLDGGGDPASVSIEGFLPMTDISEAMVEEHEFAAQRRAALGYVSDAFEEGRLDGIETDFLTQAALFAAFKTMVETYGEEAVAVFAERLPTRIREFEFSARHTTQ